MDLHGASLIVEPFLPLCTRWLAATPTTLPTIAPPAAPALPAAALLISIGELW